MNWHDVAFISSECTVKQSAEMIDLDAEPTSYLFLDVDELADYEPDSMLSPDEYLEREQEWFEEEYQADSEQDNTFYGHVEYEDSDHMEAWDMAWFKAQRREHQATLNRMLGQAIENTKAREAGKTVFVRPAPRMSIRERLIAQGLIIPAPIAKVPDQSIQIPDKEKETWLQPQPLRSQ